MATTLEPTRSRGPATTTPCPTTLARAGAWASVAGGVLLLVVLTVALDPDPANSLQPMWVPTQAGHCVAFLLLVLGLPAVAASFAASAGPRLGRSLGVITLVGYVGLLTQLVLSVGSHVYLMWVVPVLERHRAALGSQIDGEDSPLHKYYTTHSGPLGLVIGVAMVGLAVGLWHGGPGLRTIAVLAGLAVVGEALQVGPIGLFFICVDSIWLGLRLALRGSVLTPLRSRRP